MYAVAAAVYKLYPFYIIMYDVGISFTFTCKRIHQTSESCPARAQIEQVELLPTTLYFYHRKRPVAKLYLDVSVDRDSIPVLQQQPQPTPVLVTK